MPLDTFICGSCHVTFNDIENFIVHKRDGCSGVPEGAQEGESVTYTVQMECPEGASEEQGPEWTPAQGQDITTVLFPTGDGETTQELIEVNTGDSEAVGTDGSHQTVLIVTTTPKQPAKKRTRSKKPKPEPKPVGKLPLPEKGADGKYLCTRCNKSFGKERHYNTHFCSATSDYVDITKKEALKLEGDEEEEEEMDVDESDEYKLPANVSNEEEEELPDTGETTGVASVIVTSETGDDSKGKKPGGVVEDKPLFNCANDKAAFEENINVDLSGLDDMYRVHVIEQELNENANQPLRKSSSFYLYSCKTCEKVFKTQSHIRLHCLIHTDLKPFKCNLCAFTCNAKGNLYTHMRKHTGQFYMCSKCSFKTVNKSHLIEHESTHSAEKSECGICHKHYKTQKSMINHVRKMHTSKKGKEYLQGFLSGQHTRGLTIIHQCHVCNRKFKKKIDRDRHLFTHNVTDAPSVHHCQLCDYSASRKVYLEKHFLKHRVVFQCCECTQRFLSSVRLVDHLTTMHASSNANGEWETLFEQCINCSYFLPEPEIEGFKSGVDKRLINLPSELTRIDHQQENAAAVSSLQDETTVTESSTQEAKVTVETRSEVNATVTADGEIVHPSSTDTIDACGVKTPESNSHGDTAQDETTSNDTRNDTGQGTETQDNITNETGTQNDTVHDMETQSDTSNEIGSTSDTADPKTTLESESQETAVNSDTGKMSSATVIDDSQSDVSKTDIKEISKKSGKTGDYVDKLGYRKMNMVVFQKMRETFGEEECEFCGRLFFTKSDYEPHLRTHTGDKPYSCEKCDYRAITKDNLRRHIEREHEKLTFPCSECDYVSNSRSQCWSHQLKHRAPANVECPICKATFNTLKELYGHGKASHPSSEEIDWSKSQRAQQSHGKMGRRSYKCPYCEKVFYRASSDLQKHLWIHQGVTPFKCPLCPYGCRSKNNLQTHMLRHSVDKPYACPDCGKGYKSKTALIWHCRTHKDGKLFKCEKCPYEGSQKSHLIRHMETHNITKRYSCQHCDFSSNTAGYMKIHYARHHEGKVFSPILSKTTGNTVVPDQANNQGKVYRCLSCDYLFGNLSDMKRHLKDRHRVQVDNIYAVETPGTGTQGKADLQNVDVAHHTDVQVIEMGEAGTDLTASEQDAGAALQALQTATTLSIPQDIRNLDDKTASAVNILQQIIDLSNPDSFGQHQITVQSEDGQIMSVNPETIIVQQGEEVVVSNGHPSSEGGQQYLIQYVTPQDIIAQEGMSVEQQQIITQNILHEGVPMEPRHRITQVEAQEGLSMEHEQITSQEVLSMEHGQIISQEGVPLEPQQMVVHDGVHMEPQQMVVHEGMHMEPQQMVVHEGMHIEPQQMAAQELGPMEPHQIISHEEMSMEPQQIISHEEVPLDPHQFVSQEVVGCESSDQVTILGEISVDQNTVTS